jgi:hypothetical protein
MSRAEQAVIQYSGIRAKLQSGLYSVGYGQALLSRRSSRSYEQVTRQRGAGSSTHRGPYFSTCRLHPWVPAVTAQPP